MERFAVRVWLPDLPGVLGAVAGRIGRSGWNVTALEVLERQGGVAVDELAIEVPPGSDPDAIAATVGGVPGVGVEEVRPLPPGTEERGLMVLSAAVDILEAPSTEVALQLLTEASADLFDLSWSVLADGRTGEYVRQAGPVPPPAWFSAFTTGARAEPGCATVDTAGSGVLSAQLENAGLSFGVGRPHPFRGRERRELELLVRVTDRVWTALRGAAGWPAASP